MTNNFYNTPARAVGLHLPAGATAIYTARSYVQVIDLRCANVSATEASVTVEWYCSRSNESIRLVYQGKIAANTAQHYTINAFPLEPNDEIRITPGAANTVDAILTFLEIPGRSG